MKLKKSGIVVEFKKLITHGDEVQFSRDLLVNSKTTVRGDIDSISAAIAAIDADHGKIITSIVKFGTKTVATEDDLMGLPKSDYKQVSDEVDKLWDDTKKN